MSIKFLTHRRAFRLRWAMFGTGAHDFSQAEELAIYLRGRWRYDHGHERWHHYDGTRWAPDATKDLMQTVATYAAGRLSDSDPAYPPITSEVHRKSLMRLFSVNNVKRAIEALSTFDAYKTDGSDWDQNSNLLGVSNGIVDLTTGTLREGRPTDLVTRNTGIDFDPAAECPTVMAFLNDVFADRDGKPQPELVDYVLQVLGASLFGHSLPQQFYVSIGPGGAGKGTLYRLVAHVLGGADQYATFPSSNLYTKSRFGSPSSSAPRRDLIELQGRRFAYISEPEPPFDDLLLLQHSGEDNITARPLHSNNVVSFIPTHTIMFSTNNPPPIREVGANMRRRLRVIPFVRTFGDKPDPNLRTKLEAESEGFLNFLVRFAKRYHDDPTVLDLDRAPEVVKAASKAYIEANDPLAGYVRDMLDLGQGLRAEATAMYEAYGQWHRVQGIEGEPLSMVKFSDQMTNQYHFAKGPYGASRRSHYFGVTLRFAPAAVDEDEDE